VVTAVNLLTGLTFTRDNGYLLTISQLADKWLIDGDSVLHLGRLNHILITFWARF
jgi:hypothetical protein